VPGQGAHAIERAGFRNHCLKGKPLVDHEGVVGVTRVKLGEHALALLAFVQCERRQRRHPVRHVIGSAKLLCGTVEGVGGSSCRQ
jgi:hypothetical protein